MNVMHRVRLSLAAGLAASVLAWAPAGALGQLIGHYALDEIIAGTTPDSTGINGDGILNGGPTLAANAGKIGHAFSFTGPASQFVGLTDAGFGQTAFTASVWFNPDNAASQGPLARWQPASDSTLLIRTDASGNLQTFLRESGGAQRGGTAVGLPTVAAGEWQIAVITYDGQTMRTYLNGQQATNTFSFDNPNTPLGQVAGGTIAIGGRGGSEFSMTGLVDDVAFWEEMLTDGKVRALFTLADEAALNYDASEADLLFQVFDGTLPDVKIGDLTWLPESGLGGNLGDVVDLGSGRFFLNLDGSAGVLGQVIPEPASLALWLALGIAAAVGAGCRRQRRADNR